jgi:capsule polysaccharide export protein KpsE/RkpR
MTVSRKALKSIISIISILTFLFFGFLIAWSIYEDNKIFAVPKLPSSSTEGQIIVSSDGCCFYVEDIIISLVSDSNVEEIMKIDKLYEHDIYSSYITTELSGNLEVDIKFSFYYGDEGTITIPVMKFTDIETLKKQGLLLAFEERDGMYLIARNNEQEFTFKMNDGIWLIQSRN